MNRWGWKRLDKVLPPKDKFVLLFAPHLLHDPSYPGLPVVACNSEYARLTAKRDGYTHWALVPYPLPTNIRDVDSARHR